MGMADGPDIISRGFRHLFDWVDQFAPATFYFPIKATLLLLVPYVLCSLYMQRQAPTVFSQSIICVAGVLIVSAIPVDHLRATNTFIKAWLWIGCLLVLPFLARMLPTVVVPTVGAQRKLSRLLLALLALLFVLNLF